MDVRPVRPADAPLVLALVLDERSHLIHDPEWPTANRLVRSLLRSTLPLSVSGRAWLARAGDTVGLIEATPRTYVIGWDISRLVVRGDVDAVLGSLIGAVTAYLQGRGVPRLFARASEDVAELLLPHGFSILARELVLVGERDEDTADVQPLPADSRYRMPQDAWPLHQLENDATPSLVRHLQGLSVSDWSNRGRDMTEIVVEQDGRIVGWIGLGTKARNGRTTIRLLVHPDHREIAPDLLRHAMGLAPAGTQLVTRVRDYQTETIGVFLDAGFQVMAEEVLLVKHAHVVPAAAEKKRMRAVRIPSLPAIPTNLSVLSQPNGHEGQKT